MLLPQLSPKEARNRLRVAFVSSCLPRQCGIATFTNNLSIALHQVIGTDSISYVAMHNTLEPLDYPPQVQFQIQQEKLEEYRKAADFLNKSEVDLVSLQFEFGLFGGSDGNYIVEFLNRLQRPVVTTLHTVLEKPTPGQNKAFIEVAAFSQALVVMNNLAINMLTDVYEVPSDKINMIYHGVPDNFYVEPLYYKNRLQLEDRQIILTFGFLSPNKGIENMIKAMSPVAKKNPGALYIILGITHPVVKQQHGEVYRESLQRLVREKNLQDNVLFVDEFVNDATLDCYLGAADLVVCPYHAEEQITSGVLSNALGKGKAIISTPYLHARDVLSGGRGQLVNFNDPVGLAEAAIRLLDDSQLRNSLAGQAYVLGREMAWSKVSRQYLELFDKEADKAAHKSRPLEGMIHTLPQVNINFLKSLTNDAGLIQHTMYGVPCYAHGYSVDDSARAIVACSHYYNLFRDDSVLQMVDKYQSLILHARQDSGWFLNFMNFEQQFQPQELGQDTFGRCLWGLGAAIHLCQDRDQSRLAKEIFEDSLFLISQLDQTRSLAYCALGLSNYLLQHPQAREIEEKLRFVAVRLMEFYQRNASQDWPWFEPFLTYDNARISQALLLAYRHLKEPEFLETGLKTLDYLISLQYRDGYFDLIGNNGWYFKDRERAIFGQQALDASALTDACLLAANFNDQQRYLEMGYASFQWFLGRNRLGKSLYYPNTGSCSDGLEPGGVSKNKGAESIISFLLSLLYLYRWELRERFIYFGKA
ncbi:MAG: glycosyltransferase [Bacillota bacterium]|nr:glycosyltransferase [Bacillota bacterium]